MEPLYCQGGESNLLDYQQIKVIRKIKSAANVCSVA